MARKIHTRRKRKFRLRTHQGGAKAFKLMKLKKLKRQGLLPEKRMNVE